LLVNTLELDSGWDLLIEDGTLAVATGADAVLQDVTCACRAFRGEVWYDWSQGVPYLQQILSYRVSIQFVKQALISAGSPTPGVGSIQVYLTGPDQNRNVGGQVQVYDTTGGLIGVSQTSNLAGVAPWWSSAVSYEASGAAT
jgi:hypothetical protein